MQSLHRLGAGPIDVMRSIWFRLFKETGYSDLYWLTDEQMERLRPHFPRSHGKPRVDDRRVLSGSSSSTVTGFAARRAADLWPTQDVVQSLEAVERGRRLHSDDGGPVRRPGRTAHSDDRRDLPKGSPHGFEPAGKKGGLGRLIGRTKGGMNTKLHAVADANGRPISLFMTAGQVSDYTGAAALLDSLPKAQWLLGDREALQAKGITPCIPGRKSRIEPVKYDKRQYKSRNWIEIMFGRLKDWRRVATRYDRCPTVYLSAIALAATVLFWL
jgi:transposase